MVILDTAAGLWMTLNPTAGHFWRSWQSGAGFEEGVAEVAARYPDVPVESIRADAEDLVHDLCSHGLIEAVPPDVLGAAADMAGEDPTAAVPRQPRPLVVAAVLALVVASVLLRLSFRRVVPSRPGVSTVLVSPCGVFAASRRHGRCRQPGGSLVSRSGSLPGTVASRRARRGRPAAAARLVPGSAPDPYRFHAWV